MGERVGGEVGHRAACLLDNIVGGRFAGGNALVGDIRNRQQNLRYAAGGLVEALGDGALARLYFGHLGLGLFGLGLVAGFHEGTYRGRQLVERRGKVVVFELKGAALVVESHNFFDGFAAVEVFNGQALDYFRGVGLDLLKGKHFLIVSLKVDVSLPICGFRRPGRRGVLWLRP